jgi:hypothetical protein
MTLFCISMFIGYGIKKTYNIQNKISLINFPKKKSYHDQGFYYKTDFGSYSI